MRCRLLLLFFTGYSRSVIRNPEGAGRKEQSGRRDVLENLHFIKELALGRKRALECGNLEEFGGLMNVHWECKRK